MQKKYQTRASPDRCKKCGDSQNIDAFRCPASRHQCRNCHKYGYFSSLCYKKKEAFDKKRSLESRSPKANQLQIGPVYMQDSICGQSEDSSSKDSFCLQLKVQSAQVETNILPLQHLITKLAYKLKPHKKTQYMRARLDTCSDINVYTCQCLNLIYNDAYCMKLVPSNKLEIGTCTTDKIKVIGSCTLLVVHPETQCLKEVTFHVTNHECSAVLLCVTTLELHMIQPSSNLDSIPSSASLITSKADYPRKQKLQENMQVSKPSKMYVQARNNLPNYYLLKDVMLISV